MSRPLDWILSTATLDRAGDVYTWSHQSSPPEGTSSGGSRITFDVHGDVIEDRSGVSAFTTVCQ